LPQPCGCRASSLRARVRHRSCCLTCHRVVRDGRVATRLFLCPLSASTARRLASLQSPNDRNLLGRRTGAGPCGQVLLIDRSHRLPQQRDSQTEDESEKTRARDEEAAPGPNLLVRGTRRVYHRQAGRVAEFFHPRLLVRGGESYVNLLTQVDVAL